MKKLIKFVIILLSIFVFGICFTYSYADPGTSKGFATFDEETAEEENQKLIQEQQEERINTQDKSNNNYLEKLEVEGYVMQPSFDKQIHEYTINEKIKEKKIKITAIPNDLKANVVGDGEVEINTDKIRIDVTAENGTVRTYSIKLKEQQEMEEKEYENLQNDEASEVINIDEEIIHENKELNNNYLKNDRKLVIICTTIISLIVIIVFLIKKNLNKKRNRR